ncbi:phage tail length tape measure family protein [Mesorhizobium sp. WSM3626]|uniref:phage tail length tape measure family protein n=1 Tax=Mesorhizobium sp. WSM3626 TaxID=1040987 RepID=UPI000486E671|nr:phage tail length tape measure family protein [Mesorhizobium sp. WSM3626]
MTLNLALVISGDAAGAKAATAETTAGVRVLGAEARETSSAMAAASDQVVASARGATEAIAAQAAAERNLRTAIDQRLGIGANVPVVGTQFANNSFRSADIEAYGQSLDALRARYNPLFAASKQYETELDDLNAAHRLGAISTAEHESALDGLNSRYALLAGQSARTAGVLGTVGGAARLTSNQLLNLSRQGNDVITMFALGASPMMIFASQAGQIYDALESGPRGLRGSLQGIGVAARAAGQAFLAFLVTPAGIAAGAVAAAAGVAAYVLATREGIETADVSLKKHKELIDEIAASYPAAAAAAKAYEDEANRLPRSVVGADTTDRLEAERKTLQAQQADIAAQIRLATTNPLTGDRGDFSNFGDQAYTALRRIEDGLDHNKISAKELQAALGDIRIDPALSQDTRDFFTTLQKGANEAVNTAAEIEGTLGIKSIAVEGKQAQATLFDISKGLKGIGSDANSSGSAVTKLLGDLKAGGGSLAALSGIDPNVRSLQSMAQASAAANQQQLQTLVGYNNELRNAKAELTSIQAAISSAASTRSIGQFFGDVSNIKGAEAAIGSATGTIEKLFASMRAGGASAPLVAEGIEMVRNALIQGGLGVEVVNKFIDAFVAAEMQVDATTARVKLLDQATRQLQDKTVSITTVYQTSGGPISVERPGGVFTGGLSTNPVGKIGGMDPNPFANQTLAGSLPPGFGTGGFTGHGPTDRVAGFVHGQEYVFDAASTSAIGVANLEAIRRGVPGHAAGGAVDGVMPLLAGGAGVLSKIEENTFQTVEQVTRSVGYLSTLVDDGQTAIGLLRGIQSAGMAAASSPSSYSGGSSSSGSGGGSGGGSQANPFDYVGGVFYPGNGGFNYRDWIMWQNTHGGSTGFDTGGMIHPGDTQKVEFFKNPNERVIIARPDQFEDRRDAAPAGAATGRAAAGRPIIAEFHYHAAPGNPEPSPQSQSEMMDQFRAFLNEHMRAL